MLIFKIALRNLMRHKGKSLVIGFILFLGAFIMTNGMALIQGSQQGIEENLVERFTGHFLLVSSDEKKDNVLFSPMGESIKVIQDYEQIKTMLDEQDYIDSYIPMTRGLAMPFGFEEAFWGIFALGVNFEEYQRIFQENVKLEEGHLLKTGEKGLLITPEIRDHMYEYHNVWLIPEGEEFKEEDLPEEAAENIDTLEIKSELVLIGWSGESINSNVLVPIKGIVKFKRLHVVWQSVCFMDIESFRECFGYFSALDKSGTREEEEQLLALESEDDIFGGGDLFAETDTSDTSYSLDMIREQTEKESTGVNLDSAAYNYVSIMLKPGVEINRAMGRLNRAIEESSLPARIIHWKDATGQVSQFALFFQAVLIGFVFILFLVAAIIIMNTLSMAAIERTEEIGMMRAVGALKSFITKMFFAETSLLAFLFGGAGMILGILSSCLISFLNIQAGENEMLHLLFGGDSLKPLITGDGVTTGIILLIIVTLVSMVYPILVARKITPLDAVSRN
jgi:ABC-type lipoprotein release transport system permease subunit